MTPLMEAEIFGDPAARRRVRRNAVIEALRRSIARNKAAWPAAMASPPTISAGASNVASTINGAAISNPVVKANDARLTWLGTNPVQTSGTSRTGSSVSYGNATRGANVCSVKFKFWGDAFDIAWARSETPYCVWVDDVPVSATDLNSASAGGSFHYDKAAFGSRALRDIRLDWPGGQQSASGATYLIGINFNATVGDCIFASPPAEKIRGMIVSDSWGEGTGKSRVTGSYAYGLGRRLGIEDWWICGVGGRGLVKVNTSTSPNRQNYQTTIADVTDFAPDVVVVQLSINDGGQAGLQAAAAAYVAALQAALPNAVFFFIGNPNPSGNTPSAGDHDAPLAGVAQAADPSRTFALSNYSPARPFSGTGATGDLKGDGNQDFLIGGSTGIDKSHPGQAGHDWYVDWTFAKICSALQAVNTAA